MNGWIEGEHTSTGTRYNRRGVDAQGNVANFVETEQVCRNISIYVCVYLVRYGNWHVFMQVCVYEGVVTSFTQVRGSIPVDWNQHPDLRCVCAHAHLCT